MSKQRLHLVAHIRNAELQLTDLERQVVAAVRAMSEDSKEGLLCMAVAIARGSPATPPRLFLTHSRADGATH